MIINNINDYCHYSLSRIWYVIHKISHLDTRITVVSMFIGISLLMSYDDKTPTIWGKGWLDQNVQVIQGNLTCNVTHDFLCVLMRCVPLIQQLGRDS